MTTCKLENIGSNYETRMDCSSPRTLQPRSCSLKFPPLWSPLRCHRWGKVWELWWEVIEEVAVGNLCSIGGLIIVEGKFSAWISVIHYALHACRFSVLHLIFWWQLQKGIWDGSKYKCCYKNICCLWDMCVVLLVCDHNHLCPFSRF